MGEWGADLSNARPRPGLAIIPAEDQYTGGEALTRRTAQRAGAQVVVLEGLGHWWMCQDPARGASALRSLLESRSAEPEAGHAPCHGMPSPLLGVYRSSGNLCRTFTN
jgi:hypothetical protein